MKRRLFTSVGAATLVATITACTPTPDAPRAPTPTSAMPNPSAPLEATPTTSATATATDEVVGTVVRFSSDRTSVDVTIGEDTRPCGTS